MNVLTRLDRVQFPLFIPESFSQIFQYNTSFLLPEFTRPVSLSDSRCHIAFSRGEKKEDSYSVENYHSNVVVRASQTPQKADGLFVSAQRAEWEKAFEGQKYLAICTADCLPVAFYYESSDHFIGALSHAGWRGFTSGVIQNTLSLLEAEAFRLGIEQGVFRENFRVFVAPAIFGVTYECGLDVAEALRSHKTQIQTFHGEGRRDHAKLYDLCCNVRQDETLAAQIELHLRARVAQRRADTIFPDLQLLCALECVMSGVSHKNIEILRENTYGHPFFHSFRGATHAGTASNLRQWTHLGLPR